MSRDSLSYLDSLDLILERLENVASSAKAALESANALAHGEHCEAKENLERFEQGLEHDFKELHELLTTAYDIHGSTHIKEALKLLANYLPKSIAN